MAARSIGTAAISFGLVTVPVRIYPAVRPSAGISFHFLHAKDGARLRQQYICAKDGEVVPRSETVRGYEFAKDRYVTFSDEELKALDEKATHGIEITEFVPEESVDPAYFERAYYLGPDKGGEKAYSLLTAAMEETKLLALAKYAARGKDYLVLIRPAEGRLVMQQLYHSDEVRPISDVPFERRAAREGELKLARQLIEQIASERFRPERYEDEVRKRVETLINKKVEGEDITEAPAGERPRGEVVDLMEALKASLERKGRTERTGAAEGKPARRPAARRPATTRAPRAARSSSRRRAS
jgi:DNA end-binding protein Ku